MGFLVCWFGCGTLWETSLKEHSPWLQGEAPTFKNVTYYASSTFGILYAFLIYFPPQRRELTPYITYFYQVCACLLHSHGLSFQVCYPHCQGLCHLGWDPPHSDLTSWAPPGPSYRACSRYWLSQQWLPQALTRITAESATQLSCVHCGPRKRLLSNENPVSSLTPSSHFKDIHFVISSLQSLTAYVLYPGFHRNRPSIVPLLPSE